MTESAKPVEQVTQPEQSEQLPLSSFYKVIDFITIFRNEKWWEAIVIIESFGRRSIAMYLWTKKGDQWKRKHKFQIRNMQEWKKVKGAVDKLAPKLWGQTS
jgi:hypothetical protein